MNQTRTLAIDIGGTPAVRVCGGDGELIDDILTDAPGGGGGDGGREPQQRRQRRALPAARR